MTGIIQKNLSQGQIFIFGQPNEIKAAPISRDGLVKSTMNYFDYSFSTLAV